MKEYSITMSGEAFNSLFLNGLEVVVRELLELVLNQLLEARATDLCNAEPYEQTDGRLDYRNGHRERTFTTRLGKLELTVPRLRSQSVADGLFESYKRSEQAIVATIAEMVVKGVSTRDVDDIARELFGEGVSKSQASRMCAVLDPVVAEFRSRELDGYYPFVFFDAIYLKVREGGRVVSNALYIALGVNTKGYREVLGFHLQRSETKHGYKDFLSSLKQRGLEKVDLVVSDDHAGLREAAKEMFLGSSWQRCLTHFTKNMRALVPSPMWADAKAMLNDICSAPSKAKARGRMREALGWLEEKAPKAATLLEDAFEDITAVLALPLKYRVKLRTTNVLERANGEVRRRERVIRVFPSEGSVMRIIGTLLLEMHEGWQKGRLYLDMGEYLGQEDAGEKEGEAAPEASAEAGERAA